MSKLFTEPYLFIMFNRYDVTKTVIQEIQSDKDTLEEVLLYQLAEEWEESFDEIEEEHMEDLKVAAAEGKCGLDTEEVSYLIQRIQNGLFA